MPTCRSGFTNRTDGRGWKLERYHPFQSGVMKSQTREYGRRF